MSNLDSILKSRDITSPTKVHLVKAMMFPVVMKVCESWTIKKATAAKSRQSRPTLCDPIDGSPPGSCPWDSLGKNTRVGCHFLLQCMKVKSESEVAQLCLTLHDPMDCSLPGSSIHGISQARVLEWGAIAFSHYKTVSVQISSSYGQAGEGNGTPLQCSCLENPTDGGAW